MRDTLVSKLVVAALFVISIGLLMLLLALT